MTYKTILVHLQPGQQNAALLHLAAHLADRYGAALWGVAASQPMHALVAAPCPDRSRIDGELESELKVPEHAFYATLGERPGGVKWLAQSDCPSVTQFIGNAARSADLILTAASPAVFFNAPPQIDVGELLMLAGRPILIVPSAARPLMFQHALVAWNDSRECRRAATDALPLLRESGCVSVVQLTSRDGESMVKVQLTDVIHWLASHGIAATPVVLSDSGDAQQIGLVADEHGCDLIVAGAYGHSRLREWAFGGVTRALLSQHHVSVMLSQ